MNIKNARSQSLEPARGPNKDFSILKKLREKVKRYASLSKLRSQMLPYLKVTNRQVIYRLLNEKSNEMKPQCAKESVSNRLFAIIKAKHFESQRIPFKKDPVYYKYVHCNDKLGELVKTIDGNYENLLKGTLFNDLPFATGKRNGVQVSYTDPQLRKKEKPYESSFLPKLNSSKKKQFIA